jgi:hypothetical protein
LDSLPGAGLWEYLLLSDKLLETHDKYISFYDPAAIAWELYAVSTRPDV